MQKVHIAREDGRLRPEVDVEKLLTWAYRDELAKLTTSSAEGIWNEIREYGSLGGVATDPDTPQRYADFGLPHPDAKAIEKAVAGLQDLIVDWEASRDAIMGELAALLEAPRRPQHQSAKTQGWTSSTGYVRDVLMVRPFKTAALVTMHAKMGTRPDWHEATPRPHFVAPPKGTGPSIVGECRGRNLYTTGSHCPLRWSPSPIAIAIARAEYAAWHRGLCMLAASLRLDGHVALPPAAPAQPWRDRAPVLRIFAVGERSAAKLPLKPTRERTGSARRRQRFGPVKIIPLGKGSNA